MSFRPPFQPRYEDMPASLPLFPLNGALVMPQGQLPLQIFEPRYLAMTQDALGPGRLIGMIQPAPAPVGGLEPPANEPPLYRVGCCGRISSFTETEQGRLLITLTGVSRFRITEELEMIRGYRRARVDWTSFRNDFDLDQAPHFDRPRLLAGLRGYMKQHHMELNWNAVETASDLALLLSLPMVCPFPPGEKQALIECPDMNRMARVLIALFDLALASDSSGSPVRQ